MRVHHINCATMCPFGGRLLTGSGPLLAEARMVCHVLVVETREGVVLVDTGLGRADCADAPGRLGLMFKNFLRPLCDPEETAFRQVARLGLSPDDVRHIVPTHLDLDHAGGLPDFPRAQVHILEAEHAAAMARSTHNERSRYRPSHWAHAPEWNVYAPAGERWFGFECVRKLTGLPPEILIVPLHGHTRGHAGVAVQSSEGWLLHAGDAYFHHDEMSLEHARCPPALDLFQRALAVDGEARLHNQARLRELLRDHAGEVRTVSAHDPVELERMMASKDAADASGRSAA